MISNNLKSFFTRGSTMLLIFFLRLKVLLQKQNRLKKLFNFFSETQNVSGFLVSTSFLHG